MMTTQTAFTSFKFEFKGDVLPQWNEKELRYLAFSLESFRGVVVFKKKVAKSKVKIIIGYEGDPLFGGVSAHSWFAKMVEDEYDNLLEYGDRPRGQDQDLELKMRLQLVALRRQEILARRAETLRGEEHDEHMRKSKIIEANYFLGPKSID